MLDLGNVKIGTTHKIQFPFKGYSINGDIEASCGCTTPHYKDGVVHAKITIKDIPVHLIHQGWYVGNMEIRVPTTVGLQVLKFKFVATP